jgi:hypothetical protein
MKKSKKAPKAPAKAQNPELLEAALKQGVDSEIQELETPTVPEPEPEPETPTVPEPEIEQEAPPVPEPVAERKWTIPKNVGDKLNLTTDRPITYFDKRDLSGKGTKMGVGSRISVQILDLLTADNVALVRIKKGDCKRTFYASLTHLNGMLDPQEEVNDSSEE